MPKKNINISFIKGCAKADAAYIQQYKSSRERETVFLICLVYEKN